MRVRNLFTSCHPTQVPCLFPLTPLSPERWWLRAAGVPAWMSQLGGHCLCSLRLQAWLPTRSTGSKPAGISLRRRRRSRRSFQRVWFEKDGGMLLITPLLLSSGSSAGVEETRWDKRGILVSTWLVMSSLIYIIYLNIYFYSLAFNPTQTWLYLIKTVSFFWLTV